MNITLQSENTSIIQGNANEILVNITLQILLNTTINILTNTTHKTNNENLIYDSVLDITAPPIPGLPLPTVPPIVKEIMDFNPNSGSGQFYIAWIICSVIGIFLLICGGAFGKNGLPILLTAAVLIIIPPLLDLGIYKWYYILRITI
jgi:hypothetical protein